MNRFFNFFKALFHSSYQPPNELDSLQTLESENSELKKTAVALQQRNKEYELLLSGVKNHAIFILDTQGRVLSWNSGAEKLKGYRPEEIIGQPLDIFYTREQIQQHEPTKNLQRALAEGKYEVQGWRLKKDGTQFWAEIIYMALFDDQHQVYGYTKVVKDISEKRKADDQLLFLASIASNIQDPIISTDSAGNITRWNKAAELLLEWTSDEVIGKAGNKILNIDYLGTSRDAIVDSLKEKQYWHGEVVYHTKSGRPINVLVTASQLKDSENNVIGNLGLVRDITKRKQAEEALNRLNAELETKVEERAAEIIENEKRFRALIENNHDMISLCDDAFNVVYLSPSNTRITGWTEEELKKTPGIARTHPDDIEKIKIATSGALQFPGRPQYYLFRYLHKDGHYIWLEGNVTRLNEPGSVTGLVYNSRDVTQRVELETLLSKAYSLARIGSWEVNLVKNTIYWSDITREIHETGTDYTPDLTSGINFYKEGYNRDLITLKVNEAIEFGKPWDVELKIITAKGNERWIRSIGETEFFNGRCVRIYGSFQDIDQRKKAEEKIKNINIELEETVTKRTEALQAANKELEAFSYSVSHDLRAPLRAIAGFTSLLEEDYSTHLDEEGKRVIQVVKNNAVKMGDLIDDLLSFSRLSRQEIVKTNIDMHKMVNEIVSDIHSQHTGANIKWDIHALPNAFGSLSSIKQVWINLVSNAVKYSCKQDEPVIEIGIEPAANEIIYFIRDNGVGFNEAYSDKLFKVFQRLHNNDDFEGSGIGLAIVERIISKHGGRVWANGTPGKGACFFFSLPN